MNTNNSVMALATTFADRGDWTVEQQFVLQMAPPICWRTVSARRFNAMR